VMMVVVDDADAENGGVSRKNAGVKKLGVLGRGVLSWIVSLLADLGFRHCRSDLGNWNVRSRCVMYGKFLVCIV
jgi:hypothetical protein